MFAFNVSVTDETCEHCKVKRQFEEKKKRGGEGSCFSVSLNSSSEKMQQMYLQFLQAELENSGWMFHAVGICSLSVFTWEVQAAKLRHRFGLLTVLCWYTQKWSYFFNCLLAVTIIRRVPRGQ